ncbi:MAG: transposase [Candidatus Omnitrophica bacterium]|nr:transposase [Candidatus Omnitrophota bacterium]
MPRGARILLRNVLYHIINRGNQKERIFLEGSDYQEYLRILKHYKCKFRFKVFGYCLMPNHVHIMLELKNPQDLAKIMQCLTQTYTKWFNKKYEKVGHLWQGRFKNMVIQKDDYLINCISYVEANPVRAGIVRFPADYCWSSYKDRVFGNKNALLDLPDST